MKTMKKLLLVAVLLLGPAWTWAQDAISAGSNNSTITYYRTGNHLPLVLQWNVDGQDIWVFPASRDLTFNFRNDHFHIDAHVDNWQIHAQGILLAPGLPVDPAKGQVYAGVIYSVIGSGPGSGQSVLQEKIHLYNGTSQTVNLQLIGMGFKATEDEYAGPPLSDLSTLQSGTGAVITGSTVTFVDQGYIAVPPFGPLTEFQFANFKGFNPESSLVRGGLAPGQHVTMLTELKLMPPEPAPQPQPQPQPQPEPPAAQ